MNTRDFRPGDRVTNGLGEPGIVISIHYGHLMVRFPQYPVDQNIGYPASYRLVWSYNDAGAWKCGDRAIVVTEDGQFETQGTKLPSLSAAKAYEKPLTLGDLKAGERFKLVNSANDSTYTRVTGRANTLRPDNEAIELPLSREVIRA